VSRYVFKLPDLGEGTVDAEIVAWRVRAGDVIAEDDPLVEMMTEKATVEVPAPVGGRVVSVSGAPGDRVAVGAELAVFDTADGAARESMSAPSMKREPANGSSAPGSSQHARGPEPPDEAATPGEGARQDIARVRTSPAIRRRAHEAGVDLTRVSGSGPQGRIVRGDLEAYLDGRPPAGPGSEQAPKASSAADAIEEVKVIGLRRVIAERMSESARTIPHFSYVEEVDVTELEALRLHLNRARAPAEALTYLPFLVLALVRTLPAHGECNARYDAERGVLIKHRAIHVGVATQTPEGLKVPVVRDAQDKSLDQLASEIRRVSAAARTGKAARHELSGSTITVTSLGKLGGLASTPIINAPELAIIGVNRAVERPVVREGTITVRRVMNLSSSFDHRFVDGYDAAAMIQSLKGYLEHPATLFRT